MRRRGARRIPPTSDGEHRRRNLRVDLIQLTCVAGQSLFGEHIAQQCAKFARVLPRLSRRLKSGAGTPSLRSTAANQALLRCDANNFPEQKEERKPPHRLRRGLMRQAAIAPQQISRLPLEIEDGS
jgi:hypothetical protein